jgi:hypothetical protein
MKKRIFFMLLSTVLFSNLQLMAQWDLPGNTLVGGERLGSNNAFPVVFYTNAFDRGRITTAGLWGINTGTAVPGARFHINSTIGQIPLRVDVNNIAKLLVNSNGGTSLGDNLQPPSNGLYVNGNVGIGINAPGAKLHISHNSNGGNPQLLLSETESSDFSRINFKNTSTSNWYGIAAKPAANSTDAVLNFYYNGTGNIMSVKGDGNVGIGTTTPVNKLEVCGTIRSKEIIVETGWCDYVFDEKYSLRTLEDVEAFLSKNKHLPNITPASEIETNGLKVGDMSAKMMEKIEELTLYLIDLNKRVKALEKDNQNLLTRIQNQNK